MKIATRILGVGCLTLCLLVLGVAPAHGQIALAQPGVCYGSTGFKGSTPGALLTLNLATGQGTLVGSTGLQLTPGLAINSHGEIFATTVTLVSPFPSDLYRLDGITGAATFIASMGPSITPGSPPLVGVDALAFDGNDVLYAFETFGLENLYTVNPGTGSATFVGSTLPAPGAFIRGMAFDPTSGTLYGSSGSPATTSSEDNIYTLSTANGTATLVGATGLGGLRRTSCSIVPATSMASKEEEAAPAAVLLRSVP